MPSKPISQREAQRLRKRVAELERLNRGLRGSADEVLEKRHVSNYDQAFQAMQRDIETARRLGFRCEVEPTTDKSVLALYAVRRKP
jgi:hypothetical protein